MEQQKDTFLFLKDISRFVKLIGLSMMVLWSKEYLQGTFYCGRVININYTRLRSFCVVGKVTQYSYYSSKMKTLFGSQNII